VLLLRNKDQEYNNPPASFATCLCWQRSELRQGCQISHFSKNLAIL